jgi:diguanylate cyclase (GGDEF)-like protein
MAVLWDKFRDGMFRRVDAVDEAALALLEGRLDEEVRRAAEREAHKLAGAVGTFGFTEASRLAREAELMLEGTRPLTPAEVLRLSEITVALRRELERPIGSPAPRSSAVDTPAVEAPAAEPPAGETPSTGTREGGTARSKPADERPMLVIVSRDADFAGRVAMEAQGRGMAALRIDAGRPDEVAAPAAVPRVVLVDLGGDAEEEGLRVLRYVARAGGSEVLVLSDEGGLAERLEVTRLGARAFLQRPVPPARVVEAALGLLRPGGMEAERHVLALDDDPFILAAVRSLLESRGIRVTPLDDPRLFWETLESERPDLVVLDFEMPHASGPELCRVVRSDARWSSLPMLVLTGRTDPDSIERVFEAGADDFVAKPFVGPELVTRIENRLERARYQRLFAETDALTGVANRARSEEAIAQLLRMAARHRQGVSVAMVDVDCLHDINDRWGHAAGDEALTRVAKALRGVLRGEDAVGRWGGEEFVLAMYGADKDDAVQRLSQALDRLDEAPVSAEGEPFRVTFSGGVAEYPGDGADLPALYRAAEGALKQARAAGRARVLPVGWTADAPERSGTADVLVVDDDRALGELLVHALETRGYRVKWLQDGQAAVDALGGPRPALRARVILLDVDLPGYDGLSILRALARGRVLDRSRVIMLTARAGEREVLDALEVGAFDHVAKPFSVPVLLQRVRRALSE